MSNRTAQSEDALGLPQSWTHQEDERASIHRETILVVDDCLDIQQLARRFLELSGYAVVTASNGEEGFQIYTRLKSTVGLVLTDVAMPKMNGLDLAKRILQDGSEVPVVLMSGTGHPGHESVQFIAKPFHPRDLLRHVKKALQSSARRRLRQRE